VLDAIERAVAEEERVHSAELRFVIEADLGQAMLWAGTRAAPTGAAVVFSSLGVWDTEHNTGVLIYVLWARPRRRDRRRPRASRRACRRARGTMRWPR
jgi:uncharacterized membrane protein